MKNEVVSFVAKWKRKLARDRNKLVWQTAAISLVARAISMATLFLTVPLILNSVGRERYGVWAACLGMAGLLTLADGGITVHLISRVANAAGEKLAVRRLIISALIISFSIAAIAIVSGVFLSSLVDWTWLLSLSSPSLGPEARWVMVILGCGYALSFIPTVVRNARIGLQQGPAVALWDIAGNIAALALISALMWNGKGIVSLALAWVLVPLVFRMLNAATFLAGVGRGFVPRLSDAQYSTMHSLIRGGGAYLLVTLLQLLATQTDLTIIGHLRGADQVADYSIIQRLFAQPQVLINIVVSSQWAAYADAAARGQEGWIKRMLSLTLGGVVMFSIISCILLALFLKPILNLWVGGSVSATPLLVVSLASYGVLSAIANVFIYFDLSLHHYRYLIKSNIALLLIIVCFDFVLIPNIGSAGAAIAISIGYFFAVIIPGLYRFSKLSSINRVDLALTNHDQIEPKPVKKT